KKFLVILSLAGATLLTSCDNENTVNPQPLGTATITGTVFADFDYTDNEDGKTWNKVANKKVLVAIYNYYTDTYRYTETSTDANGNYSIEIKLGNQELEVDLWLVDFKQTLKFSADEQEEEIFYGDYFSTGADIVKGGEYILDMYYN